MNMVSVGDSGDDCKSADESNRWLVTAGRYIAGGAAHVFPIKRGSKEPATNWPWTRRKLTADDLDRYYGIPETAYNIGIALGTHSPCQMLPKRPGSGLIDIDLDWPHAATFADILFDDCPSFGRKSKPRSHRVLYAAGLKTTTFKLPASVKGHPLLPDEHAVCIAEIRSSGSYTVFPYGIHESGETIEWEDLIAPPTLEAEEVQRRAGLVAFCALAAQMFPPVGLRHDFMMTVSGSLAYAGVEPDLIKRLIQTIGNVNGDRGKSGHWKVDAAREVNRVENDVPTTGVPRFIEMCGLPPECVSEVNKWLGIAAANDNRGSRRDADDPRPLVQCKDENYAEVLSQAQEAMLGNRDLDIYRRGKYVVYPLRLDKPKDEGGIKREAGSLTIEQADAYNIQYWMSRSALFEQECYTPQGKPYTKLVKPPLDLCRGLLANKSEWNMPPLMGISDCPIMRRDGTVCQTEGYDEQSGTLLDFGGRTYATIPDEPTEDQARSAMGLLDKVLVGFPFDGNVGNAGGLNKCPSRSVALSILLSPHVAQTIDAVPFTITIAPSPRTGKTLIPECAGIIATGTKPPALSWHASEEENEKRLVGLYMGGGPLSLIDNVTNGGKISGDFLCMSVTGGETSCRRLGFTGQIRVPTRMMLVASGNNIGVDGDMAYRTIACKLNARMANPGERPFKVNLHDYCREHRGELVAACLTILRYGAVTADTEATAALKPFGGFEEWSRLVRRTMVLLGEHDPVDTAIGLRDDNPEDETLTLLAVAWSMCSDLGKTEDSPDGWHEADVVLEQCDMGGEKLRKAMAAIFPAPRHPTAKGLGRYITQVLGKVVTVDGQEMVFNKRLHPESRCKEYRLEPNVRPEPVQESLPGMAA